MISPEKLMALAGAARENAYSPYSGFAVGAALACADGTVYTGCNIENAAFTPTVCAERVAIFRAVADGKRDFDAIAVVGGKADTPAGRCTPCGVCRQVLAEFCDPERFTVYLMGEDGAPAAYRLSELLPFGFGKSDLGR